MKYALLVFVVIVAFTNCTKTKTNTITKNDTTIVQDTFMVRASLIGTWNSSTGSSPLVFNSSTYTVQSYPSVPYVASTDSIYDISPANIVYPKWAYTLSTNNDTLYLTGLAPVATAMAIYVKS